VLVAQAQVPTTAVVDPAQAEAQVRSPLSSTTTSVLCARAGVVSKASASAIDAGCIARIGLPGGGRVGPLNTTEPPHLAQQFDGLTHGFGFGDCLLSVTPFTTFKR